MVSTAESEVNVLVVDDNPDDFSIIRRLLTQYQRVHFKVGWAANPGNCIEKLESGETDLLMLDYSLPAENGVSFLRRAGRLVTLPPVIMITGLDDYRIAADAIRAGASDWIYKQTMTSQALGQAVQGALEKYQRDLDMGRFDDNVVAALACTAGSVDPTTGGERLAALTEDFGVALGLGTRELSLLRYGALLHDIGKLGIDNELICKPSSLTRSEFAEIRMHPLIGERICAPLRLAREVGPIIRHHHERWDGEGYVDGLAGEDIPFLARVISVVDSFDAMTSDRPYRQALTLRTATHRLRQGAGSQWDPRIVAAFLDYVAKSAWTPD